MNDEVIEIRRLIAKAAHYISSYSENRDFVQRAKRARTMVHENSDPRTVLLGIRQLEGLLQEMDKNKIRGVKNLRTELDLFKGNSNAFQDSKTTPSEDRIGDALGSLFGGFVGVGPAEIDETVTPEYIQSAQNIFDNFRVNWRIGPYQMPLHPEIETAPKSDLVRFFSRWSDSSYQHARQCIELLGYIDENLRTQHSLFGIDAQNFNILAIACQLALETRDKWSPALVRLLIVAAQELRGCGSSGMHGPKRLAAKLRVGKLIGALSQYDLANALWLADMTIESVSFSRAQILYANENDPESIKELVNRWQKDEHPLYGDIVAQGHVFLGELSSARDVLKHAKAHLHSAQNRNYSSDRGEYFVKRYPEHLEDIYLARLCRTMALVDREVAFAWSDEIATPNIRIAGYLHLVWLAIDHEASCGSWRLNDIQQWIQDGGFSLDDFWLPAYQLDQLPYLKYYPDFPAERWNDLLENPFKSTEMIMALIEGHQSQPE